MPPESRRVVCPLPPAPPPRVTNHPNPEETSIREIICPLAGALTIACLALCVMALASGGALAQAKAAGAPAAAEAPAPKEVTLTEKQIEGVLAAQKDIEAITSKLPEDAAPDPKVQAQLDAVAKKAGFAGYDEYSGVVDTISLVINGFDPETKKYVGAEAVIKAQIAQVQADDKMSAKDKKAALADLDEALKSPPPAVENKGYGDSPRNHVTLIRLSHSRGAVQYCQRNTYPG